MSLKSYSNISKIIVKYQFNIRDKMQFKAFT